MASRASRLHPPRAALAVLALVTVTSLGTPRVSRAQGQPPARSAAVQAFVSVGEPVVALTNVRVIDGTGAAPRDGQTIVIANGKIDWVGDASAARIPAGARVLDLAGHTVIPGFVGLHEHTYFSIGPRLSQMTVSAPRLYLAGGVTTIRTTGGQFPYNELNMKRAIDLGEMPGPRMYVTGPYLNGAASAVGNQARLDSEEEARRVVAYWAEEGATWLKFSGNVSRAILGAAIDEAHKRGLKVTGHLCSVTFREAVSLGIDNLEHGLITNSDYIPDKKPDQCPQDNMVRQVEVDVGGDAVRATFRDMIGRRVAMTSTLAVYELFVPTRAPLQQRVLDALAPEIRDEYLRSREQLLSGQTPFIVKPELFAKMMAYDRDFFRAGGLLVAGVDPWGNGSLPGYGDQRNYEVLVEAGLTPSEAIKVMTANGATLLGVYDRLGSVTRGKVADLAVIRGDPASRPADINNVTLVFKDGVGFDSAKLIESVRGLVGIR